LDNLLENALEAVSRGGLVVLRIERQGRQCRIAVEDDGPGVAPEALARLFERGATHGKAGGSGLGLYHARCLARTWGGELSHEPTGAGAVFALTIPIAQGPVRFLGLDPQPGDAMVIDDDPGVAKELRARGYRLLDTAVDFSTGQKLLAANRPLGVRVFVDYRLGNDQATGVDLIRGAVDRDGLLLCTSDYDDPDLLNRIRALGVPVLPKPLLYFSGGVRGHAAIQVPTRRAHEACENAQA
jgi:hypothetical protein